jgi:UDP-N-acetylmuramate: L-alanyl-gamma-D-glutamyl-meso-diaminopimelate ligase
MRIHIMGICGTFMGGLAIIARQAGFDVSGSDQNVYPPMSTQLEQQGIVLKTGYCPENLEPRPDLVVVGNAISRGNPEMEAVMDLGLSYVSGPEWLYDAVLKDRWVLAVAGTHGKTTTSSMLAWILDSAGLAPGFLIGGVPLNFGVSARVGGGRYFVVEADEYDTAFFDKRSKFVHYRPRTAILNNLEFDHADIFPDLAAIQRQFHHLVRTIPGKGLLIAPEWETALTEVLAMGCWSPVETMAKNEGANSSSAGWSYRLLAVDGSHFEVLQQGQPVGIVNWGLTGLHNVHNGIAAIAAAHHVRVAPEAAATSLCSFLNVKRRMEVRAVVNGITLYDDFAHHPTAIATTLEGLRARVGTARILSVLEPRSNTMRLGVHADQLADSLRHADRALIFQAADLGWDPAAATAGADHVTVHTSIDAIVGVLKKTARPGDHIVFMSNGSFGGIHRLAETALRG